jgi:hypothetical protein
MKLSVLLLLLSLSLIGCDHRQSLPMFVTVGERDHSVGLRLDPDQPGRYLLKEPVVVSRINRAFRLRYRGGGSGITARILGNDDREVAAKTLPIAQEAVVYLPLQRGQIVRGFWLDASPSAGVELVEAGITDAVSGFDYAGGLLTVGTTVQRLYRDGRAVRLAVGGPDGWPLRRPDGSSVQGSSQGVAPQDGSADTESTGVGPPAATGWQIALVLATAPPFDYADFRLRESLADQEGGSKLPGSSAEPAEESDTRRTSILLRLESGDSTASFRHSALPGRHAVFLYHGMAPFIPEILSIEPMDGAAVWLEKFEIVRLAADAPGGPAAAEVPAASGGAGGALQPLPADPGAVLLYDPESWRQHQYELFSWSRFPRILIMDTASYAVQSRFFKRLAFFVEKRGYRGRMVSNEEFAGLHGFNAHDYRAEDLARFFQAARERLFALNPEEELLKRILLANGIIRDEGIFSPGKGGIISISRSSYPILRSHLLTHECAHGLFFSLPEFREASFQAWDRLSEQEQEFWKLYFRWMGYDTDDPFLVVNEYQAYLFQQPRSGVRYYLAELTASRLISSYPDQAPRVRELVRSNPERFTQAFDYLETFLIKIAGVEGGRVIELESTESK